MRPRWLAQRKTTPSALNPDLLIRKLATSHTTISFFNDVDITSDSPQVTEAQYFGTKGFFASYDARLDAPLTESVKATWLDGYEKLAAGKLDTKQQSQAMHQAESKESPATQETRGAFLSALFVKLGAP